MQKYYIFSYRLIPCLCNYAINFDLLKTLTFDVISYFFLSLNINLSLLTLSLYFTILYYPSFLALIFIRFFYTA